MNNTKVRGGKMTKGKRADKIALAVLLSLMVIVVVLSVLQWVNQNSKRIEVINSFEQCKEAGGMIAEIYPEQCMFGGKSFVNPDQEVSDLPISEPTQNDIDAAQLYVGLTEEEAYARAENEGKVARIVSIDGEDQMITMDFMLGRLNLHLVDGVVGKVDVEGAESA